MTNHGQSNDLRESIQHLADLLRPARHILVFTGAGISTGSGIPDFRGPSGVWRTNQPVLFQDFMASEQARVTYWEQKLETWAAFQQARPNPVHLACVDLRKAKKLLLVVTQNIDGLHEKAGLALDHLVELHGNNARVRCMKCGRLHDAEQAFAAFEQQRTPPTCDACDGPLKPDTISFGQSLKEEDIDRAMQAAEQCDLVVALGSSLTVFPAAEFPLVAARKGVPYAIVNRGVTQHDGLDEVRLRLEGDVVALFPPAVEAVL